MYPRYSFITYGWYAPNWWVPPSTSTLECTRANIESVLHYSIAVLQHQYGSNDTEVTETGIVRTNSLTMIMYNKLLVL